MEGIYDYDKRLESITRRVLDSSEISENNKLIILRFKEDCFAQNISPARIIRYMYCLRDLARWLKMDFDKAKAEDLKKLVASIEIMKNYAPRTKYEYRATLKKFYKNLKNEENPPEVSWIRLVFKKCNDRLPSELLKEDDILKMINTSRNPRDRAIFMSLYESGCRIGEFLKIKFKDMTFESPGCIFIVQGKTGGRRVRVISAEPYILEWINKHPDKDNPNAFLWVENNHKDPLQYDAFRKVLRVAAQRAGIKKKVNLSIISGDSREVDVFTEIKKQNPDFYKKLIKRKADGIFTSPPYVGQIDYHDQHAYAYELFKIPRRDDKEIGPLYAGSGAKARESYVEGISRVFINMQKFLKDDADIFIVANDKYNLYPLIAEKCGLKIVNQFKRPVLNRTERDRNPYAEIIFQMKKI